MAFLSVRVIFKNIGINKIVVSWLNNDSEYKSPMVLTHHINDDEYRGRWFIRNDKLYLARYKDNTVTDLYILRTGLLHKVHQDGSIDNDYEENIGCNGDDAVAGYYDNFTVMWDLYDNHIMIVIEITFSDISTNAWVSSRRLYNKRNATCVFDKSTRRAYLINLCSSSSIPSIIDQSDTLCSLHWNYPLCKFGSNDVLRISICDILNGTALLLMHADYKQYIILYDMHNAYMTSKHLIICSDIMSVRFLTDKLVIVRVYNMLACKGVKFIVLDIMDGSQYEICETRGIW